MRARNIKPGIFNNELLAVADPLYTVIFAGLWCAADREGRLEDRPGKLHIAINPGRGFDGTDRALTWLSENGFIRRYEVDGRKLIFVCEFAKHQKPHQNEKPSALPGPGLASKVPSHSSKSTPEEQPRSQAEHNQGTKHLALIPDSLIPDSGSLIPDSSLRESNTQTAAVPDTSRANMPRVDEEPKKQRSKAEHGTRIPEPFLLTSDMRQWAAKEVPNVDLRKGTAEFVDYWRGVPGTRGKKLDWLGTWRNRMRELDGKSGRLNGTNRGRSGTSHAEVMAALDAATDPNSQDFPS